MSGAKRTEPDQSKASGDGEAPLWSRTADGNSGVRVKRPVDPRSSALLSGQYRLLGPLGPSTYGNAFTAQHVPQRRLVTVHFLARDTSIERVLTRELPLAVAKCAQLSHPNVIPVEAYGRSDGDEGLYYVVTGPLEGVSLQDHLHASGPLPVKRALALMRQIGRALRAAHKLGIVHGDLRPANVRLVDTAQGEVAKVIGFGKSALLSHEGEPTSEVRTVSSPVYAAPELYQSGHVDARSDVYALGAMLFRMIAGEPPYPGRTQLEMMESHLTAPVPSLRDRAGPHVPYEVDALVMRCLEKRPHDRFPDVVAFMQAMRIALIDESELLSRDVSDLLSLPPGVNSILPSVAAEAGELERASIVPESARSNRWLWVVLGALLLVGVLGEIWWETHGSGTLFPRTPPADKRAP